MNTIRKFLPPIALVSALALVPVAATSYAAADTTNYQELEKFMSRASPPAINATMMGGAFLVLFVANNLLGWIGTFYEQLGPLAFWSLHAAIGGTGGVLAFLYSRTAGRLLEPEPASPSTR